MKNINLLLTKYWPAILAIALTIVLVVRQKKKKMILSQTAMPNSDNNSSEKALEPKRSTNPPKIEDLLDSDTYNGGITVQDKENAKRILIVNKVTVNTNNNLDKMESLFLRTWASAVKNQKKYFIFKGRKHNSWGGTTIKS